MGAGFARVVEVHGVSLGVGWNLWAEKVKIWRGYVVGCTFVAYSTYRSRQDKYWMLELVVLM